MDEYRLQDVRDVAVYDMTRDGENLQLSKHFRLHEFACGDGSHVVLVHPSLLGLLESIRWEFNRVYDREVFIEVSSGYRTVHYNENLDPPGAEHSKHLLGMAADIKAYYVQMGQRQYIDPEYVADIALFFHAGGVGRYETFTHVDVDGENRRW